MTSCDTPHNEGLKNKGLWGVTKRRYVSGTTRVCSTRCHTGSTFCVGIWRILPSNGSRCNFYWGCLRHQGSHMIKALKLISVLKRDLHLKKKSSIYSSWSNCNKEKELYIILKWKFTEDFLPLERAFKKTLSHYWCSREVLVTRWKWKHANPSHLLSRCLQWQSLYQ